MPQPYESGCDLNSPNRNLAPITAELDDQGRLAVGGCVLSDLAKRYGTPLYVLDEASIRKALKKLLAEIVPKPLRSGKAGADGDDIDL